MKLYGCMVFILLFTTLHAMERKEEVLIPGIPSVQQEGKLLWQMHKAGLLDRLISAFEKSAGIKAEALELKKRKYVLESARSIYASFDPKNPEDLKKIHERVGGRARRDGISPDDAEAALTVIVNECERVQEIAKDLKKRKARRKMKAHSDRYLIRTQDKKNDNKDQKKGEGKQKKDS